MGKSHPNKHLENYVTYQHSLTNFDIVHFELSILVKHLSELKSVDDIFNPESSFKLLHTKSAYQMAICGTFDSIADQFIKTKEELEKNANYIVFYHFCGKSYYVPISRVGYDVEADDSYTKLDNLPNTLFKKEIRFMRDIDDDQLTLQSKQLNLLLMFKNNQFHIILTPHRTKRLSFILNITNPVDKDACKVYNFPDEKHNTLNAALIKTFTLYVESNDRKRKQNEDNDFEENQKKKQRIEIP